MNSVTLTGGSHGTKIIGALIGVFGLIESIDPGQITAFLTVLFGDRGPGIAVGVLGWIAFIRGFVNSNQLKQPGQVSGGKQSGIAHLWMLGILVPVVLAVAHLSACSSLGLNAPQGLDQQIANGDQIVKSAAQATDSAYLAHQITQAQAQQVDTMIHQVVPFLDQAKAAEQAGDTAGASKNFQLASAVLTALQTYVNARSTP